MVVARATKQAEVGWLEKNNDQMSAGWLLKLSSSSVTMLGEMFKGELLAASSSKPGAAPAGTTTVGRRFLADLGTLLQVPGNWAGETRLKDKDARVNEGAMGLRGGWATWWRAAVSRKAVRRWALRRVGVVPLPRTRRPLMRLRAAAHQELNSSQPYFIRCIKPNMEQRPKTFTSQLVLEQLRNSGLIGAVALMQQAYPTRVPYDAIYDLCVKTMGAEAIKQIGRCHRAMFCEKVLQVRTPWESRTPSCVHCAPAPLGGPSINAPWRLIISLIISLVITLVTRWRSRAGARQVQRLRARQDEAVPSGGRRRIPRGPRAGTAPVGGWGGDCATVHCRRTCCAIRGGGGWQRGASGPDLMHLAASLSAPPSATRLWLETRPRVPPLASRRPRFTLTHTARAARPRLPRFHPGGPPRAGARHDRQVRRGTQGSAARLVRHRPLLPLVV